MTPRMIILIIKIWILDSTNKQTIRLLVEVPVEVSAKKEREFKLVTNHLKIEIILILIFLVLIQVQIPKSLNLQAKLIL